MKKFILFILFLMIFNVAYGQILLENNWILDRWVGIDGNNNNYEFVFNNNGTGSSGGVDIIFSINDNSLTIFSHTGTSVRTNITVYRINEQRMVLYFRAAGTDWYVNLNKIL